MRKIFLSLLFVSSSIFPQETDISGAIQQIEKGNSKNALKILQELRAGKINDPSVIYLDALLTQDGDEALRKYSTILEKHPESRYADASLYRIFSYYYSLGYYKKAETYLERLKKDYPESPYISTADRKIPDSEELAVQAEVKSDSVTNPLKEPDRTESGSYNFTIQAGAFLNADNAKKLNEQLKKENYYTEITTKEVGGTILNVVNVGRFALEEEAKPLLTFLQNQFSIKGRVVAIKK
ncbi:MAG: SPOR domain-containing protein [Melioribacteraceae bacterium]